MRLSVEEYIAKIPDDEMALLLMYAKDSGLAVVGGLSNPLIREAIRQFSKKVELMGYDYAISIAIGCHNRLCDPKS